MNKFFRVYTNSDLIGVELAGASKNIIAFGAGILDGIEFGDNSKAAMMTRGLTEISRFGVELGADLDRKSTRLNSSHANISYAVFCLKKKKSNYSHHILTSREHVSNTVPT